MSNQPTISRHIFGGAVTLYGFGINHADPALNWSLKGIEHEPKFRVTHSHVVEALGCLKKTQRIYSPSPDEFNSEVVDRQHFLTKPSYSLALSSDRVLYRGVKADGYGPMSPSDAFVMSAADCALVVVRVGNIVFAAHAGRNSLFDRPLIDTGVASKTHASVVDAIMAKISSAEYARAQVFIGFTLSKGVHFEHPVDHPKFGKSNERLLEFIAAQHISSRKDEEWGADFWERGQLDMKWLIQKQFEAYGVGQFETDNLCTFLDTDSEGRHVWFSQRRTSGMRNLFAAVRNY